ncbi:MAG: hypothetical protein MJZ58_02360, partial [Paludibacteraceae bacterium]|nr:hypothetical protein [Paludibacteraceae bacterium]
MGHWHSESELGNCYTRGRVVYDRIGVVIPCLFVIMGNADGIQRESQIFGLRCSACAKQSGIAISGCLH